MQYIGIGFRPATLLFFFLTEPNRAYRSSVLIDRPMNTAASDLLSHWD